MVLLFYPLSAVLFSPFLGKVPKNMDDSLPDYVIKLRVNFSLLSELMTHFVGLRTSI